jgi:hypothetical protein
MLDKKITENINWYSKLQKPILFLGPCIL